MTDFNFSFIKIIIHNSILAFVRWFLNLQITCKAYARNNFKSIYKEEAKRMPDIDSVFPFKAESGLIKHNQRNREPDIQFCFYIVQ